MPRIIICADCGKEKEHTGKGLCRSCYHQQYDPPLIICAKCAQRRPHHAKRLCHACYLQQWEQPVNICANCGKLKPYKGHNLCIDCYMGLYQYPIIVCSGCGKNAQHKGYGLCRSCYQHYYRTLGCVRVARYRARKRSLPDTLTEEQTRRLLIIGQQMYPGEKLHLDHIVPVSKNGGTTLANIHAIPASLNAYKHDKLPEEIYQQAELEI